MNEDIKLIINKYLKKFPNEKERLHSLSTYLNKYNNDEIIDWNSANGHLTVGAFVYCKKENKFLVLYHKDLKMYLYPGGHIDKEDNSLFAASKRELQEETGLKNLEILLINNEILPFDIDTHLILRNDKVNMPSHYHFDFRFLFFVEELEDIVFDIAEFKDYKWISFSKLESDKNYGKIVDKLRLLGINKKDKR